MLQDFIVFICFLQHPSLMSQKWISPICSSDKGWRCFFACSCFYGFSAVSSCSHHNNLPDIPQSHLPRPRRTHPESHQSLYHPHQTDHHLNHLHTIPDTFCTALWKDSFYHHALSSFCALSRFQPPPSQLLPISVVFLVLSPDPHLPRHRNHRHISAY